MHELKIAEDLTTIVLETAVREKLKKVTRVNVTFGQLVNVVPEIFRVAFSESVRGTVAEDAGLDIEVIPFKTACLRCGSEFSFDEISFVCQRCGSGEVDIISGKELFIKSIEGE